MERHVKSWEFCGFQRVLFDHDLFFFLGVIQPDFLPNMEQIENNYRMIGPVPEFPMKSGLIAVLAAMRKPGLLGYHPLRSVSAAR